MNEQSEKNSAEPVKLSRRDFIRNVGLVGAGSLIGGVTANLLQRKAVELPEAQAPLTDNDAKEQKTEPPFATVNYVGVGNYYFDQGALSEELADPANYTELEAVMGAAEKIGKQMSFEYCRPRETAPIGVIYTGERSADDEALSTVRASSNEGNDPLFNKMVIDDETVGWVVEIDANRLRNSHWLYISANYGFGTSRTICLDNLPKRPADTRLQRNQGTGEEVPLIQLFLIDASQEDGSKLYSQLTQGRPLKRESYTHWNVIGFQVNLKNKTGDGLAVVELTSSTVNRVSPKEDRFIPQAGDTDAINTYIFPLAEEATMKLES